MTSEKLQRTSYRDPNTPDDRVRSGTTTLAENEQDMDLYYRPLERIHGSSLHGWGVANGLSVTATLNSPTLTIQPGVALNSSGQHIALAVGGNAEVGQTPTGFSTGATFVPVTSSGVAMPTTNLTGDKYLTIQFFETFDSDSYNNLGIFRYFHTPWVRLLDVAGFTNDGTRIILAKVSFAASPNAGQVTALSQDLRQATDLPVGSVHLQRSLATSPSANVEAITSVEAGVIRAYTTGGLDITVPNANDEIHLERDDGTNFAKVSLGAEKIVARQGNGTESVVIDTEAGTITTGTNGVNGEVSVNDAKGNATIVLNGGIATVEIGNADSAGVLQILDTSGQVACSLDGSGKGRFASINSTTASTGLPIAVYAANGGNTASLGTPSFAGDFQGNVSIAGNMGIGTTTPNNQLVNTSQASFGGNTSNTGTEPIEVQGPGAGVSFYDRTGGAAGRWVIYSDRTGGAGTETLRFWSSGDKASITQDGTLSCTSMQASNDAGFGIGINTYGRGFGVYSRGTWGIQATNFNNQNTVLLATPGQSGWFDGDVVVNGNLSKPAGSFKIDHPLDPGNKYLSHSFVESPDMKNIYDGVAVLDANGEAEIELPAWFETLNRDFRYQLTCIGGYAPVYIAEKVHDNRFKIAGGQPGMEVSWLVTGIRQDAWAKAHPIPVEEDKSSDEQGYYLHPELHGASEEKDIRLVLFPAEITQKM